MPVFRVASFANGADVVTTIVDGRILMEDGKVLTVDEREVMEEAQEAANTMLDRSGLRHLLEPRRRPVGRGTRDFRAAATPARTRDQRHRFSTITSMHRAQADGESRRAAPKRGRS